VEVAEAAELVVAAGPLEEAVEAELVAPRHPGRVVELDFVPFDHPRRRSRSGRRLDVVRGGRRRRGLWILC
jgi:hypothetical protein